MLRPVIDEHSLKLQREYAGHVLTMRGSLPSADAAAAPDVDALNLVLPADGLVDTGQRVAVLEALPTPPVAAFLGTLSVPIEAQSVPDPDHPGLSVYSVKLVIPAGAKPEPTAVQLRWPSRGIGALPLVQVRQPAAVTSFKLLQREGSPDQWAQIGRFDAKPVEVEFGDTIAKAFEWRDGFLFAVVPNRAGRALVRVTTNDGRTRRSDELFSSNVDIYGEDWLKVTDLGRYDAATINAVHVASGNGVKAADPVVTLKAGKDTFVVRAPAACTVRDVRAEPGASVVKGTPLVRTEPVAVAS